MHGTLDAPAGNAPRRIAIARVTDDHAEALAEFFRMVWTPDATAASVRAARARAAERNPVDPGAAPPTWIALREDRPIGYVTTIPIQLWDGLERRPAHWLKGLMVAPEYRNGPIGHALLKAAAAALPRSGGLAVAAPARRLFQALGYDDLGPIPNLVRPLEVGRILPGLAAGDTAGTDRSVRQIARRIAHLPGLAMLLGWPASRLLDLVAASARITTSGEALSVEDPTLFAEEIDHLWSAAAPGMSTCTVRDAAYLLDRYPAGGGSAYRWIFLRTSDRLAGLAILRRPGEPGHPRLPTVRLATLVDVLLDASHPWDGGALLGGVEAEARRLRADAILASASAPVLSRLLRRQCYFPIGGNVHLLFRDTTGEGQFGRTVTEWWLTRGDGNADDAL